MIKLTKLGAQIILSTCLISVNPMTAYAEETNMVSEACEETVDDSLYMIYFNTISSYYGLDDQLVANLAKSVTNDYKYNVGLNSSITNEYAFCLEFVHKLYTNPEYFSVDLDDYKITSNVNNNLDRIDFEEFTSNICSTLNVNYRLAKAISDYETGYQSSNQALCKNNFGGLKGDSGYMTFPSAEAGIISYIFYLKKLNGSKGIENIEALSGIYVNGNRLKPDRKWIASVTSIYKNIEEPQVKQLLFDLD